MDSGAFVGSHGCLSRRIGGVPILIVRLLVFALVGRAVSCLGSAAWAGPSVVVSPARIEVSARAGAELPPINVTNRGQRPVAVSCSIAKGAHDREGGLRLEPYVSGRAPLIVGTSAFLIRPGETRELKLRLAGWLNGEAGVYPVVVLGFHELERGVEGAGLSGPFGSVASMRVAVPTIIALPGRAEPAAELTELRAGPSPGDNGIRLHITLKNTGNVHIRPRGRIRLDHPLLQPLDLAIPPLLILPGCERSYEVALPSGISAGDYRALIELMDGDELLASGRAVLTLGDRVRMAALNAPFEARDAELP